MCYFSFLVLISFFNQFQIFDPTMGHVLFWFRTALVTIFLPQMLFCYHEDNGLNFLVKKVIDQNRVEDRRVQVHFQIPTINKPIKGPHQEEHFNAICMSGDSTIAGYSIQHQDVSLVSRVLDPPNKPRNEFTYFIDWRTEILTCFVPQTIYGFHQLKRVYTLKKPVHYVVHNYTGGEIKIKRISLKKNKGKKRYGVEVTVTTYSPYLKFKETYLQFKGQYRTILFKSERGIFHKYGALSVVRNS